MRGRSYTIAAVVQRLAGDDGVLIAHGDRHAGYALRIEQGHLVHDYVHAGVHSTTRSSLALPTGRDTTAEVRIRRTGASALVELWVDGAEVGRGAIPQLARARVGYTGVDLGCDRGLTVGGYPQPAQFSGLLRYVDVTVEDDQWLDEAAILDIEGSTG